MFLNVKQLRMRTEGSLSRPEVKGRALLLNNLALLCCVYQRVTSLLG